MRKPWKLARMPWCAGEEIRRRSAENGLSIPSDGPERREEPGCAGFVKNGRFLMIRSYLLICNPFLPLYSSGGVWNGMEWACYDEDWNGLGRSRALSSRQLRIEDIEANGRL